MLSQVNVSQNSLQTLNNTHSGFQPLARIITERFDNIQIDESNNYLRENKAEEPLTIFLSNYQSKVD